MKPVWTKQRKTALWILAFVSQFSISTGLHSQALKRDPQNNAPPQGYSVLELASNGSKGLRLPQLTSGQFTAMIPKLSVFSVGAKRLVVFNMDTNCVEIKS